MKQHTLTRLRAERLLRGWSARELGLIAGIDAREISRFETGRAVPYRGQLARLAEALGVEPPDVLLESISSTTGATR